VLTAAFVALIAALTIGLIAGHAPAEAASGLYFPAPAGTHWAVASGYNTATHSLADGGDPYALDIVRTDGPTAGTPLLAPIDGTITFVESSGSRCIGIRDAARDTVMMCHLNPDSNLSRGTKVTRGMHLATVAKAGDAANNGLSHIHFAVSSSSTSGYGMGTTVPFIGAYAIEGVALPATTEPNAYAGVAFTSTNAVNHAPVVNAGADQQVRPGATVTLSAQGTDPDGNALTYVWSQSQGPTVALQATGATATFTAPDQDGVTLRFVASAIDPGALFGYDAVDVTVSATAPEPSTVTSGVLLSGSLPANGGFGLLLFSGGTSDQLVAAAGCPAASVRFWVVTDGRFVPYFPAAASFVNAEWNALFAAGLPERTIVIGACG
jgi:hypothetical protein